MKENGCQRRQPLGAAGGLLFYAGACRSIYAETGAVPVLIGN